MLGTILVCLAAMALSALGSMALAPHDDAAGDPEPGAGRPA